MKAARKFRCRGSGNRSQLRRTETLRDFQGGAGRRGAPRRTLQCSKQGRLGVLNGFRARRMISLSEQERSGLEAIKAVLDALRSAGGVDVDLSEVPMNLLVSHRVSVGAHNELARTVLAHPLNPCRATVLEHRIRHRHQALRDQLPSCDTRPARALRVRRQLPVCRERSRARLEG
jgi:hypothetical protein